MNNFIFNIEDINQQTAKNAFYHTSFSPEKRGESVRLEYVEHMQNVSNELLKLAETEEQKEILNNELNRYKQGYISRLNAYLYSRSRCASSMITGSSNFPVEQNRKRMKSADNKSRELQEFSEKALKSIRKKIAKARTDNQVNSEEFERLLSVFNKYMEWNNGAYLHTYQVTSLTDKIKRSFNNGNYEAVRLILEHIQEQQKDLKKPYITKRHSIWKLLDNATIQAKEESKKTGEEVIKEFSLGQVVRNYDDERIRIFFNEKPNAEIIALLNKSAWKWSPYNKAWQRKTTTNAMYSVIDLLAKFNDCGGR